MENIITEALAEVADVKHLIDPAVAAQHIPPTAQYACIATVMMLDNPQDFKLHFSKSTPYGPLTASTNLGMTGQKYYGYLYHDGTTLYFATETQALYTIPLNTITSVNASYEKFFLLHLPENKGLLVGQVVPIRMQDGHPVQSSLIISSQTGDWYQEFVRLGVITPEQARKNSKYAKVFLVVWALGIAGILFLIFHKR
jgi:hypothetical protein